MKLGIICSQFPEMHETFVLRELESLDQSGFDLGIYSLKLCRDKVIHPEAGPLIKKTTYLPWNQPRVWLRGLSCALRRPGCLIQGFWTVVRFHGHSPVEFSKGLIVLLQSLVLAEKMKADGVKHIHSHWAVMPTTAAYLISKFIGVPYSFTAHAWDIFVKNPALKEKMIHSRGLMTCTAYNHRLLRKYCPQAKDKIHLNYHGVDLCWFFPPGQEGNPWSETSRPKIQRDAPKILLSIGRFSEQKGFEDLIDAVSRLSQKRQDFRLVMVGSKGPSQNEILKRIADLKLEDFVILKPGMPRRDLINLYRQAFIFVLPCVVAKNRDRDGIPNVVLEAMAMGLPVVTTGVSGLPEAVCDQKTGSVIRPHHPEDLAGILEALLNQPDQAEKLGKNARDFVSSKFDARLHMKSLVNLMSEIVPSEVSDQVSCPVCWLKCREKRMALAEAEKARIKETS